MNTAIKATQLPPSYREIRCQDCALHPVCLPPSIQESELPQLDAIIERGHAIQKNASLFRQGEPFNQVFAVRSGAIKTSVILDSGIEQITGFYLPGEIIGLESIGNTSYVNSANALETTTVCAIPYKDLRTLGLLLPSLQDHVMGLMSREIQQGQHILIAISKLNAQQRVAMFLLTLATRYQRRRLSGDHFHLPMPRGDIANYLGLTLETVSRVFTQLQQQHVLEVNGKDVRIVDRRYLCHLIGTESAA